MNSLSSKAFMFGVAMLTGLLLLASTAAVASAHGPGGRWGTQRSYGWQAGPGYGGEQFGYGSGMRGDWGYQGPAETMPYEYGYGPGMMNNWEYNSAPYGYQPHMRGNWTGQRGWGYQAAPGSMPHGYGRSYSGRGW